MARELVQMLGLQIIGFVKLSRAATVSPVLRFPTRHVGTLFEYLLLTLISMLLKIQAGKILSVEYGLPGF